jgi:hypothetical protein
LAFEKNQWHEINRIALAERIAREDVAHSRACRWHLILENYLELTTHEQAALYIFLGLCLIISGLTSKTLISESDIPATDEERASAKATPLGRVIVTGLGLVATAYGMYLVLH